MGASSTTPLTAAAASATAPSPNLGDARSRAVPAVVSRVLAWVFFIGGLVGAILGIAGLHVEITVAGLILACTTGLILLKLRAETTGSAAAS
ncbi:hypothetical protein ACFXNW_16685 [Nocardia sp. NPDC059180]|uniref:hypothetical protein n=1 Tax=Nocardia sp. NPDC059180 TaxID=3346761 RepID=UPI0036C31425